MRYWVNFNLRTLTATGMAQDLSEKGYYLITESEYNYWCKKFWEEKNTNNP